MANETKNEYRQSLAKTAKDNGYNSVMKFLEEACSDSVVPACCKEGCSVEPDGTCEHGCPSPLLAAGMI
jgi:hypothetical protein